MPKKKSEPIVGTGKNPAIHMIQKSNPLMSLSRSELSLSDLKIFDAYLARINSHQPERRTVKLEKGEIEDYLGVSQIKTADLKERLKHLGTMVPVDDPTRRSAFRMISLFEEAECVQDDDGLWQVSLTCTQAAMKYIFQMEDFGFFKYTLHSVTMLRSRYAYVLFMYLEKNRRMHLSWEVPVEELRYIMKADDPTYQQFKHFKQLVLQPAWKELNEKTKTRFTYEPMRKGGRTVKTVRFTLESLSVAKKVEDGTIRMDLDNEDEADYYEEPLSWASMGEVVKDAAGEILTPEEATAVADALIKVSPYVLPHNENRQLQIYDATTMLVHRMKAEESRQVNLGKPAIKNKYKYLLKMIQNLEKQA